MRKFILIGFKAVCVIGALNLAATMFVTFASIDPSGFAPSESEAVARVRDFYGPAVFLAAGYSG